MQIDISFETFFVGEISWEEEIWRGLAGGLVRPAGGWPEACAWAACAPACLRPGLACGRAGLWAAGWRGLLLDPLVKRGLG